MWHRSAICIKLEQWWLIVYREKYWFSTAEIVWFSEINRSLFLQQDIWWCSSPEIQVMLLEPEIAKYLALNVYQNYSDCCDSQNADYTSVKLIQLTNYNMNDTECIPIIYIFLHPISCPIMVNTNYSGSMLQQRTFWYS